jgi:SnoaL-like domain
MLGTVPEVITGYFEADARRDLDALTALFTNDAVVIDAGQTWRGRSEIRAWREGPGTRYLYSTQLSGSWQAGPGEYLLAGTLFGNFLADRESDVALHDRRELDQATAHRALTSPSHGLRRRRA